MTDHIDSCHSEPGMEGGARVMCRPMVDISVVDGGTAYVPRWPAPGEGVNIFRDGRLVMRLELGKPTVADIEAAQSSPGLTGAPLFVLTAAAALAVGFACGLVVGAM